MNIISLNPSTLERYLDDIIFLDQYYIHKLDDIYTTFHWNESNFRMERPGKWTLSHLAISDEKVVGFWIASRFDAVCHTHRVAVHPENQGQGISKALWKYVHDSARKLGLDHFTVMTNIKNEKALNLYQKIGFIPMKKTQIFDYLKLHNRTALVKDNYIQENDGSRYYVLELVDR